MKVRSIFTGQKKNPESRVKKKKKKKKEEDVLRKFKSGPLGSDVKNFLGLLWLDVH